MPTALDTTPATPDTDGDIAVVDEPPAPSAPRRGDVPRTRPRPARRRPSRSGWITAAIAALTGALYTWNLAAIGLGNSFYAAAVKSASVSWKAWFFGAIDPGSFITVDKPPLAMWVMGLSARVFGFSTWSMLVPDALAGVAAVLVLHHLVRRWRGDVAAHLAAIAFALTPVATLMFRYNNPDAFLTLLGLLGAWALWAALETGRTRHLVTCALLTGLAFDTKMLQAFLIVPAFVVVYLLAGPPKLGRRIVQLLYALVALVVASSWWAVIVAMWPASARPYIGSTTDNSIWSLVLGYNGLNRIFGSGSGAGPGGGGGAGGGSGFGGTRGWLRLFNTELGGQIAWLLPLAAGGLLAGLWLTRRAARTDRARAGWLLWGLWAATCAGVFSLSKGIFHAYYTVQLAPAVAALAGAGAVALWELGRRHRAMTWTLPAAIAATAALAVALLRRTPSWFPWLRGAIVVTALVAIVGIVAGRALRHRALVIIAGALATVALLAGPAAYSLTTAAHSEQGSIVLAGPSSTAAGGFGGGGIGGAGGATTTSATKQLVAYLEAHRGSAKYIVATFGSQSSASIIVESGMPVITIGGFNGSDPAPTLAQFERLVADGQVRYLLVDGAGAGAGGGGGFGGPGGQGSTGSIATWAAAHGKVVSAASYGGSGTLYDLSGA